jgi:mutator protein MutT
MSKVMKKLDVVAAVLKQNDEFFIAKRPPSSHLGDMWEFPGGKIEGDESHIDAIKREMMEEFCVEIEVIDNIGDVLHQYPDKLIHLFFYTINIAGGIITPTEHPEVRWVKLDELLEIGLAGGDQVFAEAYLDN